LTGNENLIGDVVGVIVEKVLMEIGVQSHAKVAEILGDHNMTFSDCYRNPDVLNFALKELYGDSYLVLVDKIRNELTGFENHEKLDLFIQKISE